jgi:NAD(P)-dependent dehydrogenase (short-subunit alcohol dehydrogenase family)
LRWLGSVGCATTGASSGIGKSIAIALGAAGANVCVNYVTGPEKAETVVEEIEKDGSHAFAQQADVSSEADVLQYSKRYAPNSGPFIDGGMTLYPGFETGG